MKEICEALKELHRNRLVHMDVKPSNIFQVLDPHTGDSSWKLGDFDQCRRVGEPVGGFTAPYASPELAIAMLAGDDIAATDKMDIFSAGLTVLEVARGQHIMTPSTVKFNALSLLSGLTKHGSALQRVLADAVAPLDLTLRSALASMLEISPDRRKTASTVLQTGLLSGNVTTTVRQEANKEVLKAVHQMRGEVLAAIDDAAERLSSEVQQGNAAVLAQMRQMRREAIPALLGAVKQAQLELQVTLDNNGAELAPGSAEARDAAAEVQRRVAAQLDATVASMPGDLDMSLDGMLKSVAGLQPQASSDAASVSKALDAMMEKLDAMGTQMGELNRKVDTMAEEREAQMVTMSVKIDQLLLKEHEQVQTSALKLAQCPSTPGLMYPVGGIAHCSRCVHRCSRSSC